MALTELQIASVVSAQGLTIPPVGWVGFVVCVVKRVNNGTDLWDAVEECAKVYK
jgi:hypothetical protein